MSFNSILSRSTLAAALLSAVVVSEPAQALGLGGGGAFGGQFGGSFGPPAMRPMGIGAAGAARATSNVSLPPPTAPSVQAPPVPMPAVDRAALDASGRAATSAAGNVDATSRRGSSTGSAAIDAGGRAGASAGAQGQAAAQRTGASAGSAFDMSGRAGADASAQAHAAAQGSMQASRATAAHRAHDVDAQAHRPNASLDASGAARASGGPGRSTSADAEGSTRASMQP
jgi:hypothetical protein